MTKKSTKQVAWPADKIEQRKRESLVPYARNSRTHSPAQIDQIAASMREWGWTMPVLVDEKDMIIAGHARIDAARKLGWDDVPVLVARGWSEAQKRAYIIADNKLSENAGWDKDALACELEDLAKDAFDLGLTGFSEDELVRLMNGQQGLTDPDHVPEVPESVSVLGDLWILGAHRLICGSATDPKAVEQVLNGVKPHLMVTDPPYGVSYDPQWRTKVLGSRKASAGKLLQNDDEADWTEAWKLFPGNVAYVWHGSLHVAVVAQSLVAAGLKLRAQIVWVKTRPVISRGHYNWQHEAALYAVEDKSDDQWRFREDHDLSTYAVKGGETAEWKGDRKQSTVWFIEHLKNDTGHGTQKPVECMKRPMLNNSEAGQAVYEPFSGSGTTIIAAEILSRQCHAIELDPQYVDVGVCRWQEFTGKDAILEATGRTFAQVLADRKKHGKKKAATA